MKYYYEIWASNGAKRIIEKEAKKEIFVED
jgi:hypothetical protein